MAQQGNPFYVKPLGGVDIGQRLMQGIQYGQMSADRDAQSQAAARQAEAEAAFGDAIASKDPAILEQVAAQYPEMLERVRAEGKFQSEQSGNMMLGTWRAMGTNPAQAPDILKQIIKDGEKAGIDMTESKEDYEAYLAGEMTAEDLSNDALQNLQMHPDPRGHEYYKQISGAVDRGDLTSLGKLQAEKAAAVKNGAPQEVIDSYDNAIAQEGAGSGLTAETQTMAALTEGMSPEDVMKARRVKLGLEPRAVSDQIHMVGKVPYKWNPDTDQMERVGVAVGGEGETTDLGAEEVGRSAGIVTATEQKAKDALEASNQAMEDLKGVNQNIQAYDEIIAAIDEGANTGALQSYIPSIKASTLKLENAANRLGLEIIQGTSFGALSAGEMKLAMDTALPPLPPEELREYVLKKQAAQRKLGNELERAALFLGTPGNSRQDYLELQKVERQAREEALKNDPGKHAASLVEKYTTPGA